MDRTKTYTIYINSVFEIPSAMQAAAEMAYDEFREPYFEASVIRTRFNCMNPPPLAESVDIKVEFWRSDDGV